MGKMLVNKSKDYLCGKCRGLLKISVESSYQGTPTFPPDVGSTRIERAVMICPDCGERYESNSFEIERINE